MKISLYIAGSLILWGSLGSSAAASLQKLTLSGSSTLAPLVSEIAKAYEKNNANVQLDVQTGGSSKGLSDCRDGLNDLGMISRPLKPEDGNVRAVPIARDGIAFMLNKTNSLSSFTGEQVVRIFRGEIQNWKELGGPDQKVVVVNKAEGRAALELFLQHFKLKPSDVKASLIIGDEEQGLKTIASNPGAIGYVAISSAELASQGNSQVKSVALDGAIPTTDAVLKGSYTLVRPLSLVQCGKAKPAAEGFIQFASSPEGQKLVKSLNYIPL